MASAMFMYFCIHHKYISQCHMQMAIGVRIHEFTNLYWHNIYTFGYAKLFEQARGFCIIWNIAYITYTFLLDHDYPMKAM